MKAALHRSLSGSTHVFRSGRLTLHDTLTTMRLVYVNRYHYKSLLGVPSDKKVTTASKIDSLEDNQVSLSVP